MAELSTEPTSSPAACCSTEAQSTCCEPSEKAVCCDTSAAGGSCGCTAGAAGLIDVEIRPTHRVHEHAGSAIIRASKP